MWIFKRNKLFLWLRSASILYSNVDPEGILDSVIPVPDTDKVDGDSTEEEESLHSRDINRDKQVMIPGDKYYQVKNL